MLTLTIPNRYIVRIRCVDDWCERHNAPHLDNPGHVATIVCFTLAEARQTALNWERGTIEFRATVFDPSGTPVAA